MNDQERQIEDAIERAVREMFAVEPRPDLRQRVLRQVEPRTPGWFTVPRVVAVTAVAAVVILAVLPGRRAPDPVPVQTVVETPKTTVPVPQDPDGLERAVPEAGTWRGRSIVQPRTHVAEPEVGAPVAAAERGVSIDPLPPIEPIAFAPVQTARVETPAIFIPAIELERLEIEPLSPPR